MPMLGALLSSSACRHSAPPPLPDLPIAYWHWSETAYFSEDENALLESIGVEELFIRCSSVELAEGKPRRSSRVTLGYEPPRQPIHLVVRFEPSVVEGFENASIQELADLLVDIWKAGLKDCAGLEVRGLQVDFDCPSRLLSRYAELLKLVREGIGDDPQLSIGALPTWFIEGKADPLLPEVDFVAAQFYEGSYGRTIDTYLPIASAEQIKQGVQALEESGEPYWAGIACYGRGLLYDDEGNLLDVMASPAPSELLDRDSVTVVATDVSGFSTLIRLEEQTARGRRQMIIDTPNGEGMVKQMDAVRQMRPKNCRGIVMFRYPELREEYALSLVEVRNRLAGIVTDPLEVSFNIDATPFELIEVTGIDDGSQVVNVLIKNTLGERSAHAVEAAGIELLPGKGLQIEDVLDCGGCRVESLSGSQRSSLARAEKIRLMWTYLPEGGEKTVKLLASRNAATRLTVRAWLVKAGGTEKEIKEADYEFSAP